MADPLGSVSSEVGELRVTVASKVGLHARPAAVFVRAAQETGLEVTVRRDDGRIADALSILAVVMLDVRHGEEVIVRAVGPDAQAVVDRLGALLAYE